MRQFKQKYNIVSPLAQPSPQGLPPQQGAPPPPTQGAPPQGAPPLPPPPQGATPPHQGALQPPPQEESIMFQYPFAMVISGPKDNKHFYLLQTLIQTTFFYSRFRYIFHDVFLHF